MPCGIRRDDVLHLDFEVRDPVVHVDDEEQADECESTRMDTVGAGQMVMGEKVANLMARHAEEKDQGETLASVAERFEVVRPPAQLIEELLGEVELEDDDREQLNDVVEDQCVEKRDETRREDSRRSVVEKNEDAEQTGTGERGREHQTTPGDRA